MKDRERERGVSMKDRIREEENNSNTKVRIREVKMINERCNEGKENKCVKGRIRDR